MGSYFPESQRGTTESGWFLGHASPKVFSGVSFIPNGTPRFPSKQRSVRTLGYCRRGGKALNIERPGPTQALLHSMLDVRCWAFLRTPERRAAATTEINDPGYKAASKNGSAFLAEPSSWKYLLSFRPCVHGSAGFGNV